ncbi:MAG TPA: tetratricopeptide repeat protein [Gallionellaceae bacterium]
MSLLLDALKKSGTAHPQEGEGQAAPGGKPELSLEAHPDKPRAAASAPASGNVSTSRSAGENLFAAKKAPAASRFNYSLGLVPTALIIGSVLGIAGAIYVWYEIQPPKQGARHVPPPVPVTASTPAPRPLIQPVPATVEAAPQVVAQNSQSSKTSHARPVRKARPPQRDGNIQIEHQPEVATVNPTLAAAYQAYQQGDYASAWQRYREVLSRDPNNRDALLGLAAIAQQQGQDDTSKFYYRQVLALDPRDPVANAGMASFASGDTASKESRLKQLLTQNPQSPALHFALGNLYAGQSRWSDAQQAYFNAYSLESTNASFAFNLATSLDHLGQNKLAAQYYQQALQLDPSGNAGFDRAATEQRLNKLNAP